MNKAKIITGLFLMCAVLLLAAGCEGAYGSKVVTNDGFDETGLIKLWDAGGIWDGDEAGSKEWTPRLLEIDNWADQTRAELTFLVEPYGAGITDGYYQFKPCADASQTSFAGSVLNNNGAWQLLNNAGTYTFIPTAADWASIKANGLFFDGWGVKLTAVYINEAPPTDDGKKSVSLPYIIDSFKTGPEGDGQLTFAAEDFDAAATAYAEKDRLYIIYVTYTLVEGAEAYSISFTPNSPTYLNIGVVKNDTITKAGVYQLQLDKFSLETFNKYGLILSGKNIIISKVECSRIQAVSLNKIVVNGLIDGKNYSIRDIANSWAPPFGWTDWSVAAVSGTVTFTAATPVIFKAATSIVVQNETDSPVLCLTADAELAPGLGKGDNGYGAGTIDIWAADTGSTVPYTLTITVDSTLATPAITAATWTVTP